MLYLLSISICAILLFNPIIVYAGFFEESKPMQEGECNECRSELPDVNPGIEKKVAEIEKAISGKLDKKETPDNNEIIFFTSLTSNSSVSALDALAKFKKDNPAWKIKGVVVGPLRNLRQNLLQRQKLFNYGIEFSIDINGNLTKEFDVIKTPSYVIICEGKHYKAEDQLELKEILNSLINKFK